MHRFRWRRASARSVRPFLQAGGVDEKGVLDDFVMTEIDLLKRSNFSWCDLFGDDCALLAAGFKAWAGVFFLEGRWYAVGGFEKSPVRLLGVGERTVCLAQANDWLNEQESDDAAHKSRRWLNELPTPGQLRYLPRRGSRRLRSDPLSGLGTADVQVQQARHPAGGACREPKLSGGRVKCAVCSREARGFGYFNSALRRSDPRRYSDRWVFCSMRCMNAFSKVMERLTSVQEDAVIDPSDLELAAMRAALAPLGDYVSTIGMDRPLADYRKEEVLRLVEVVVDAYQAHMLDEHERMASERARLLRAAPGRSTQAATRKRLQHKDSLLMIDLNHQLKFHEQVTVLVDVALQAENATREKRRYLGGSRLGVACERALQFEYADAPVDVGAEFPGRTLRIFEVGHALEDLAIRWLRLAGFDLYTPQGW
jgi:hypothetical protein